MERSMRRQLWVLWTSVLFSMATTSVVVLLVLPRIMKNPIRPPEDPFLQWMRWGFIGLVFGAWLLGIWSVQKARRLWLASSPAGIPSSAAGSSEPHPTLRWSSVGWAALEGGIIVDLVYWLLSQDWGNTLPALLIHGLTFLGSNPAYIAGQAPGDPGQGK